MIEWLSDTFGVSINAVLLKYVRTAKGDELLARTMIIPEEVVKERGQRQGSKIPMSDEPGTYHEEELENLLRKYLAEDRPTPRRIRTYVLPLCLEHATVTRDLLEQELVSRGEATDEGNAGIYITTISREPGFKDRDYLRQVIRYEKPQPWEKDDYRIPEEYQPLIRKLLDEVGSQSNAGA